MELAEILTTLEHKGGMRPETAIREAVRLREEIIPALLRILEDTLAEVTADGFAFELDGYSPSPLYALYLLAQFREARAYPLMLAFARLPGDTLHELIGDSIDEDFGRMLASVCGGNTASIEALIEDPGVYEYSRAAGIYAFRILAAQGAKSRDEVMAYYKSLFNGRMERTADAAWCELVSCATRLYPEEVYEEIVAAFDEGLVFDFYMSLKDVDKVRCLSKDKVLDRLATATPGYIEDCVGEIRKWGCFGGDNSVVRSEAKPLQQMPVHEPDPVLPKIGPNEPCPCGSGRKHKKCCGRIA
jgi:hypothetical protein